MYQVELVWNREFDFVPYGETKETFREALDYARGLEQSGDGARVKKTRIINTETGEIIESYRYDLYFKEELKNKYT